jgi:malate dehydrogenase (oxaloacetate-decarboxylating)(NADP+)
MRKVTPDDALAYHRQGGRPGKLAIVPTKPMSTQHDLALAYTPGVAVPVLEIAKCPDLAYEYTAKGNLVAVVSNGTAILGLGDRGAIASKPVMEGKAVLFKKFADVDVFDIELDTHDPEVIIQTVKVLAPTFGGINLEDIKAPDCFYIEETLRAAMDIPVFHDDQHGTAIISGAALLNALELVGKRIEDARVVISGAGAAAISCGEHMVRLGVQRPNLMLVDSKGVVYRGRGEGMNAYKERFAVETDARSLADALRDADVFYGLSAADVLKPEMLRTMAERPLVFAMANPDPEIRYDVARETRPDAIIATGRSDFPNQINNVLGFPFIFRGALDARARAINEEMKVAATHALAALTREDVPDRVLRAYGLDTLRFGPDYIVPKPLDPRLIQWVPPAIAQAAMATGVARKQLDLDEYREQLAIRLGKGEQVRHFLTHCARRSNGAVRLVFAEGEEPKILRAAVRLVHEKIAQPILLGREAVIRAELTRLGLDCCAQVVDPENFDRSEAYALAYLEQRARKGITLADARRAMRDPNVLAPMMVKLGDADAAVSGLAHHYPDVIRPALQIHHTAAGTHLVAGVYIMIVNDGLGNQRPYLFTDATVNIEPSAEDLAAIACLAADFARRLGLEPRVAMLSFSNFGSTRHPAADKVRRAVELARQRCPDLQVDGEMQADTAVVPELIEQRFPFSQVKDANVLVFPSLDAANVAYKLLARLGNAETIGPILLGMGAPVHVLQAGDSVRDIVDIAAIAVMDAMGC